jgi:dTDP-4-amino-4,6-dideoxygalactose transaminase
MIPRHTPTYTYSDILRSLGKCIQRNGYSDLQQYLSNLYKAKYVFLFCSAKSALYALLKAYDNPGGVLMPAYNDRVVPETVSFAGYRPEFIDIDPYTLNMPSERLQSSITSEIKVIIPVHLFGIPCNLEDIARLKGSKNILVIEDAAPAFGAKYRGELIGGFGDASIFSFHPTKIMSAEGGGALLTNDSELAHRVEIVGRGAVQAKSIWYLFSRALARKTVMSQWFYPATLLAHRLLRGEQMYEVVKPRTKRPSGYLRKPSGFDNHLAQTQLGRLEWNLARRRKIAQIYQDGLSKATGLIMPVVPDECNPSWIQFPIFVEDKFSLYKYMQRHGVDLSWTFKYSCADSYGLSGFPNAQRAAKTVMGLPTSPGLSDKSAQRICELIKSYMDDRR